MKYLRLKKQADFQRLFNKGKRASSPSLTILYRPAEKMTMGISIGKKHGKSVRRNRIKRLLREAFRAVLKDAGKQTGVDFTEGRLSIQLYPSRSGGCEMFVTRSAAKEKRDKGRIPKEHETERESFSLSASEEPRWERSECFLFETTEWLISVCRRLITAEFSGRSAAFRDERGRWFLLLENVTALRPLVTEYGTAEEAEALRLYICEHGRSICPVRAVETLGRL